MKAVQCSVVDNRRVSAHRTSTRDDTTCSSTAPTLMLPFSCLLIQHRYHHGSIVEPTASKVLQRKHGACRHYALLVNPRTLRLRREFTRWPKNTPSPGLPVSQTRKYHGAQFYPRYLPHAARWNDALLAQFTRPWHPAMHSPLLVSAISPQ